VVYSLDKAVLEVLEALEVLEIQSLGCMRRLVAPSVPRVLLELAYAAVDVRPSVAVFLPPLAS
jgi:hypothetical protein